MEVNYKNKRYYRTAKYPLRQHPALTGLIWVLSRCALIGKQRRLEKIGLEGLKPPYLILSNHMHFIDFELLAMGTWPHRVNNVVNIDGFYQRPWLLELIGAICTRKFTMDLHLVKSINKVLKRGDVLCLYPEAQYSPCGVPCYIPDSVGKLIRMNKVPVVAVVHRGNHLYGPAFDFRKKRKVPFHTTMTQILTAEQAATLPVEEINAIVRKALTYDDYQYQKDNGIRITEPYRAEGLHKVLYQCPHCGTESKMASKGTELFCTACGKRWLWQEDGNLRALNGETEFTHIPDWFRWEREQVHRQILDGTYSFQDEVEVYSMPRCWRFMKLGKATLTHDAENGFVLEGFYRGKPYRIHRPPLANNGLHVEYDFRHLKPQDCIDISTETDSFYCYPTQQNVATKLTLAVEELYQLKLAEKRKK